jgi:hypothetical protein
MKKEINFLNNQGIYEFKDNEDVIFQVNKEDMQFDVKLFYNAFFLDDEYKDIEFINRCEDDKEALRVFTCAKTLLSEVAEKLKSEEKKQSDEDFDES